MDVICLEDQAFYAVIERVVASLKANDGQHSENKWISPEDAMKRLVVTHN